MCLVVSERVSVCTRQKVLDYKREVLANTTAPGATQLRQAEGDKWEKEKEKDAMPSSRSGRAGEVTRN